MPAQEVMEEIEQVAARQLALCDLRSGTRWREATHILAYPHRGVVQFLLRHAQQAGDHVHRQVKGKVLKARSSLGLALAQEQAGPRAAELGGRALVDGL